MASNQQLRDDNGFEDTPHMVHGEVEMGQQLDLQAAQESGNGQIKLVLATFALLFAAGWTYANQRDFKQALGFQTEAACVSSNVGMMGHESFEYTSCSPNTPCSASFGSFSPPASEDETCPLALAASGESSCCEQGRRSAIAAALMKQKQSEQIETAPLSAEVATAEQKEEQTAAVEESQSPNQEDSSTSDVE